MADNNYGLLPEEAGLLNALLAGEQGLPTAQPVTAVPVTDGQQSLPTAQPVTAEPVIDYTDLSKINLAGLSPSFVDPGPAYDPNSIYYFHTGNDIGVPNASGGFDYRGAHPLQFLPGMTFEMRDKSGKVIGTASSPEEMQNLVALSNKVPFYTMSQTAGQGLNPYASGMMPEKTDVGSLGSLLVNMAAVALPAIGGAALGPALAGSGALGIGVSPAVGVGLGTAAGTAASGAVAGKSIEDILLQSAIAGLTAGGLQSLAGSPVSNANKVAGLTADLQTKVLDGVVSVAKASKTLANAGATAADIARFAADVGGVAASTAPTVIGNIANVASSAAPTIAGAAGGILGAVTSAAPGTVVQGRTDPADILRANPAISISDPLLSQFTPDEVADAAARIRQEQAGTTVSATPPSATVTPPTILPPAGTVVTGSTTPAPVEQTTLPAVLPPAGTTVIAPTNPPSKLTEDDIRTLPNATTLAPNTSEIDLNKNNLLKDILKYYSIGSGVLDALGVGQGGGTSGTATTYTPTLGAVPTFGRGAYQPFTGNYETYGQGPEWSFFSQPAAAPATTPAPFTLLPPPTTTGA